jgi:DNA-binding NtrC family response regulator
VRLPVVPAPPEPREEDRTLGAPGRHAAASDRVVLVVDDEPRVRDLQGRLLRRAGFRVHLAASVAEARRVLEHEHVDLVVSDIRMPHESGVDLHAWVAETRPELAGRFIFVTGDVQNPDTVDLARTLPDRFIRKPFEIQEYIDRVMSVLDAADPGA